MNLHNFDAMKKGVKYRYRLLKLSRAFNLKRNPNTTYEINPNTTYEIYIAYNNEEYRSGYKAVFAGFRVDEGPWENEKIATITTENRLVEPSPDVLEDKFRTLVRQWFQKHQTETAAPSLKADA